MKPFLEKGLPNESCILEISPCSLMRRGRLLRPLFYSTKSIFGMWFLDMLHGKHIGAVEFKFFDQSSYEFVLVRC